MQKSEVLGSREMPRDNHFNFVPSHPQPLVDTTRVDERRIGSTALLFWLHQ
jgi:hypothetical protein